MYKMFYAIFTFLLISLSSSLLAKDLSESSNKRQVFEIGISMSIPPWVIKENDTGIELDILKVCLGEENYDIRPVYVPFERAYRLFDDGQLDAVMNAKANVVKHGYLSDPVVTFQNYAISLSSKGFTKNIPMSFLNDKNVVGDLSPEIRTMTLMRFPFNLRIRRSQNHEEALQRRTNHKSHQAA